MAIRNQTKREESEILNEILNALKEMGKEFNEKIANLPTKIKEVHLDGITVTKDVLVKNILSDLLQVNYLKNSLNVKEYISRFKSFFYFQIIF